MARYMVLLMTLMLGPMVMANQQPEHEIAISLTVPDAAWTVTIDEIYQVENELWVIATVNRPAVMGLQVISTVQDSVRVCAPALAVKYFVLGKTWKWENEEPYTFLKDRKQIDESLRSGSRIYARPTDSKLP